MKPIAGDSNVRPQSTSRPIDAGRLPIWLKHRPVRGVGWTMVGLGFVMFFVMARALGEDWMSLFLSSFAVVWLGLIGGGLVMGLWRADIVIDASQVRVEECKAFRRRAWAEPLEAYEGVLLHSTWHHTRNSRYRIFEIQLRHPDPKKCVTVFESKWEKQWRRSWRDLSRALKIPALEKEGETILRHEWDEVDKPVAERLREALPPAGPDGREAAGRSAPRTGGIHVAFDPSAPPPKEIAMRFEDGAMEIRLLKRDASVILILCGIVLSVFAGFLTRIESLPFAFAPVMIAMGIFLAANQAWKALIETRLRIEPGRLTVRRKAPWGERTIRTFDANAITMVKLSNEAADSSGRMVLCIEEGSAITRLGGGMSTPSLEWLKACLLATLARM